MKMIVDPGGKKTKRNRDLNQERWFHTRLKIILKIVETTTTTRTFFLLSINLQGTFLQNI